MQDYRFVFSEHGGAGVLMAEPVDPAASPAAGEVRVRHQAIGVNFIDVYMRTGLNPVAALPSPIGLEAVGIVEAVGDGVDFVRVGDRVGYGTGAPGAYATVRVMPADPLIPIPDWIASDVAAAVLTKGMTTEMLVINAPRSSPAKPRSSTPRRAGSAACWCSG